MQIENHLLMYEFMLIRIDITNLTPKQWYDPTEISVDVNDTIIWTNNDTEPHTVQAVLVAD